MYKERRNNTCKGVVHEEIIKSTSPPKSTRNSGWESYQMLAKPIHETIMGLEVQRVVEEKIEQKKAMMTYNEMH